MKARVSPSLVNSRVQPRSTRHVAPPGGAEASYGTNPVACAFPTAGAAFVIDMGTSAFMSTDLLFRQRRGELLPEGVAIDAQGKPTRDPSAALEGAILPFGGYKGFALALMMQGFGVLAGSGTDIEKSYGYLVIAIKPDLLMSLDDYRRDMSAMLAGIRATPRLPGVEEIRLPSERAFRERARSKREGIVIDRHIFDALNNIPQGRPQEKI